MNLIVLGLSLSSSWGNGHAVTYRALLQAFAARGHDVLFLERDAPWYAAHRDLENPGFCRLAFYEDLRSLQPWSSHIADSDAVIVGSYVPDGIEVGRFVRQLACAPVAFYDIDTPVTLAGLRNGATTYLDAADIAGFDLYLSFTGGPTLDRLERHYGSPAARALYCSADPAIYRPLETPTRWDLSYLGTYSDDRQPVLTRLLLDAARAAPGRRFVVAGPLYPAGIDWPANVARIDHVAPAEHPAFYSASRFTLNVTRADMAAVGHSPSIRLFEAAACEAPILSDAWDGIDSFLQPDREIILAQSTADVLAALAMDETARRALGKAGRQRILQAHTPAHRAATLERELQAAITRKQSAPHRPAWQAQA